MILKYDFVVSERPFYFMHGGFEDVDYEVDTEEFEYDADTTEFFNQLSEVEFVAGCKHAWENLSEEDKQFFLDPKNGYALPELMNGNEFNWNAVFRDMDVRGDFISELLREDEEYWEEEIKDYFEDEAREAFDDLDQY